MLAPAIRIYSLIARKHGMAWRFGYVMNFATPGESGPRLRSPV
jgi:hypothetical protein